MPLLAVFCVFLRASARCEARHVFVSESTAPQSQCLSSPTELKASQGAQFMHARFWAESASCWQWQLHLLEACPHCGNVPDRAGKAEDSMFVAFKRLSNLRSKIEMFWLVWLKLFGLTGRCLEGPLVA